MERWMVLFANTANTVGNESELSTQDIITSIHKSTCTVVPIRSECTTKITLRIS